MISRHHVGLKIANASGCIPPDNTNMQIFIDCYCQCSNTCKVQSHMCCPWQESRVLQSAHTCTAGRRNEVLLRPLVSHNHRKKVKGVYHITHQHSVMPCQSVPHVMCRTYTIRVCMCTNPLKHSCRPDWGSVLSLAPRKKQ